MNGAHCIAMISCGTPWDTAHHSYYHRNTSVSNSYKLVQFIAPLLKLYFK